ncbi:hypothetical protein DFH29DRAFT_635375 [Suillus ampliporus]|nr:hypothetical protein DFH29DRAFT_635375 [Suillus ampliporus]
MHVSFLAIVIALTASVSVSSATTCSAEFVDCVTTSDCCQGLECALNFLHTALLKAQIELADKLAPRDSELCFYFRIKFVVYVPIRSCWLLVGSCGVDVGSLPTATSPRCSLQKDFVRCDNA